jgi:hypothetical protein
MGKGAKAATSDLEQARTELIRAEELLRQRHANTRVVLLKYKEATAQLEHARALALSLQRRLKEESRQNAKLRAEILKRDQTVLKRDETIEELRRQLRQGNSQSVTRPQTPSDEDLRPGVQMRERSEPSHPSVQSFDSMNVSRRVAKRKVREEVQDHVRDALDDMLNFILDGDQARSLDDRLDTAAETYLREIRVAGNSDEVAEAAMGILVDIMRECVSGKAEYTVALAVALEVWPELAEVVGRSALTFPKAETSGRQPVGDLYEMAVLTLRNTFPKTNV